MTHKDFRRLFMSDKPMPGDEGGYIFGSSHFGVNICWQVIMV
jgi:hypothetical protein